MQVMWKKKKAPIPNGIIQLLCYLRVFGDLVDYEGTTFFW